MRKYLFAIFLAFICSVASAQDMAPVLKYIQNRSVIKEGGTEVFLYNDVSYVISVASLAVNDKTEARCKVVGSAKAKREMLSYINGSNITSYTDLKIDEKTVDTLNGTTVESTQEYVEVIRETVMGTINQITPLGGWYSEDHGLYYFAIYKSIQYE